MRESVCFKIAETDVKVVRKFKLASGERKN